MPNSVVVGNNSRRIYKNNFFQGDFRQRLSYQRFESKQRGMGPKRPMQIISDYALMRTNLLVVQRMLKDFQKRKVRSSVVRFIAQFIEKKTIKSLE